MEEEMEEEYLDKLDGLLAAVTTSHNGNIVARRPCRLFDYLYLGDFDHATSLGMMTDIGITHILNCAGVDTSRKRLPFPGSTSVRFSLQFEADDHVTYDMLAHFEEARTFIEDARSRKGKVLVHCARGVNRSAVLCIAYIMTDRKMELFDAIRKVALARGKILTNHGFRRQLVRFAHEHNLLKPP